MPALNTQEYGDTMLKEIQDAGATSKEVVGALNELVYAGTSRDPATDPPLEFQAALAAYVAIP